ncbi:hypothetical protein L837_0743 [Mycobacterium avium MAV_061107_1842]|jgi:hypothetical protein|nr:hypothetical protein L837_0743 [Mycobacterium avium MAV_061107_1842]
MWLSVLLVTALGASPTADLRASATPDPVSAAEVASTWQFACAEPTDRSTIPHVFRSAPASHDCQPVSTCTAEAPREIQRHQVAVGGGEGRERHRPCHP